MIVKLNLLQLEKRVNPVVGTIPIDEVPEFVPENTKAFFAADLVSPQGDLNGVARLTAGLGPATSFLFKSGYSQRDFGHHLLTSAHTIGQAIGEIVFTVYRHQNSLGVNIPIKINPQQMTRHFGHNASNSNNDIGIISLLDSDINAFHNTNDFFLVSPFGATLLPVSKTLPEDLLSKKINFVGYGRTGAAIDDTIDTPDRLKRIGANKIDYLGTPFEATRGTEVGKYLSFDFDNNNGANDFFGVNYNTPDKGLRIENENADAMVAPGDSGGPWIYNGLVIGITSHRGREVLPNKIMTDVDNKLNSSYGEYDAAIRVDQYSTWIQQVMDGYTFQGGQPTAPASSKYHVVLDMKYQAYGQSVAGDELTITAINEGGNLNLYVTGPDGELNGLYYSAPANNILSLTIRGSDKDHETIRINGPLGLAGDGKIEIDGRGGNDKVYITGLPSVGEQNGLRSIYVDGDDGDDTLYIDDSGATLANPPTYTLDKSDAPNFTSSLQRTGNGVADFIVHSTRIEEYTLSSTSVTLPNGTGGDTITIKDVTSELSQGLYIFANGGSDSITVGGPTGLDKIASKMFIDGGDPLNRLEIDDRAGTGPR